jgi:hypothetical protein
MMIDPRPGDKALGLELQIVELVEQRERAVVQGRRADAEALQPEIDRLQTELASLVAAF